MAGPRMDEDVRAYLDALPAERRPLFDRLHGLVLEVWPAAEVVLSYRMPTFVVGTRRLYVGVWRHGLSFYGWEPGRDGGLSERHPELAGDRGTFKLTTAAARQVDDDELRAFVRHAGGLTSRSWTPLASAATRPPGEPPVRAR